MTSPRMSSKILRKCSRIWGLQTCYRGPENQIHHAAPESLLTVLSGLSETQIHSDEDLLHLIQRRHQETKSRGIEPAVLAWLGQENWIHLWLRPDEDPQKIRMQISPNTLSPEGTEKPVAKALPLSTIEVLGQNKKFAVTRVRLKLPNSLEMGYFNLQISTSQRQLSSLLIAAPEKLGDLGKDEEKFRHSWGLFTPLYGLRSAADWGLGSFTTLRKAMQQISKAHGKWLGLLPIMASRYESADCDPSPYSSLSRLYWNEIYLDVESLVNASTCPTAKELLAAPGTLAQIRELNGRENVDYFAIFQLKAKLLSVLAKDAFAKGLDQSDAFKEFLKVYPDIEEYAAFRVQSQTPGLQLDKSYHIYVQFQCHRVLDSLSHQEGIGLYMDFPVGVNRNGYDFAKYSKDFLNIVDAGAPPEPVFQKGQCWGFPSFHPQKIRESNYVYLRRCLAAHLRYSRILRLDHVMGFHRLFVIPRGQPASQGLYLRFKPNEMFAIACIEATRANADVIGENLGVVPDAVNEILEKRKFKGMSVGQFAFGNSPDTWTQEFPAKDLACLNSADMPPFKAFLSCEDLDEVVDLGILDPAWREKFRQERFAAQGRWFDYIRRTKNIDTGDPHDIENKYALLFPLILEKMAASPARFLILNAEDTWGETKCQNIPSTWNEVPNWRRRYRISVEDWAQHPGFQKALSILAQYR